MSQRDKQDYYELLQLDRNCSLDDIKQSYRGLAKKYHPDRNRNNPESVTKFKAISEAYQVLSDPNKRTDYDTYGHREDSEGFMNDFNPPPFSMFMNMQQFEDFFQASSNPKQTKKYPDGDINITVCLSLNQLYHGCHKSIEWMANRVDSYESCLVCKGAGTITRDKILGPGLMTSIRHNCSGCQGAGERLTLVKHNYQMWLHIPPGCRERSLTFVDRGHQFHPTTPKGKLIITLEITPTKIVDDLYDTEYQLITQHLLVTKTISLRLSLLGGSFRISHPEGVQEVYIPESDSTPSQSFRIVSGQGLPHPVENPVLNSLATHDFQTPGKWGDLIICCRVEYPILDSKRKKLLAKLLPQDPITDDESIKINKTASIGLTPAQNTQFYHSLFLSARENSSSDKNKNQSTSPDHLEDQYSNRQHPFFGGLGGMEGLGGISGINGLQNLGLNPGCPVQ